MSSVWVVLSIWAEPETASTAVVWVWAAAAVPVASAIQAAVTSIRVIGPALLFAQPTPLPARGQSCSAAEIRRLATNW